MALSPILTPAAMLLELVICVLGLYAGYARNKIYGFPFAITFLLFAFFDYLGLAGVPEDMLAVLNICAVLAALFGMYLVIQEK